MSERVFKFAIDKEESLKIINEIINSLKSNSNKKDEERNYEKVCLNYTMEQSEFNDQLHIIDLKHKLSVVELGVENFDYNEGKGIEHSKIEDYYEEIKTEADKGEDEGYDISPAIEI